MFRPCKRAIIRLFTELVGRLYTRGGEYLRDGISSYFVVRGVNIGYQRFIYVCVCIYIHICVYIYTYMYMCVCVCVCVCVRVHYTLCIIVTFTTVLHTVRTAHFRS